MKTALLASTLAVLAATAFAADEEGSGRRAGSPEAPAWQFGLTAYPTHVRNGDDYTAWIGVADKESLHLEARHNYEAINATSAFAGWTFSGGETISWQVTPLVGGVRGSREAFVPGLEMSLGWRRFDYYLEGEYVHDRRAEGESYTYAWTELGFKPLDWLRFGAAAQRTRIYGDREFQRGPFVQASWRRAKVGAYWFNPGSSEQVFVGSIGISF